MPRLTGPEYKQWLAAFGDAFTTENQLEALVLTSRGVGLEEVAIADNVPALIQLVVRTADTQGWLTDLLREAMEIQGDRAQLKALDADFAILSRIEPENAFEAVLVHGDPMFDRKDFRAKLSGLNSPASAPVLLVQGDRYSGKSWSSHLITYVAARAPKEEAIKVALVDFETDDVAIDAEMLGRRISQSAGFGVTTPPSEEQVSRWVLQYCSEFGTQAKEAGGTVWVVIDHLQKALLGDGAMDFLQGFGKQIPVVMPNVRLIILSFHEREVNRLAAGIGPMERDLAQALTLEEMKDWLARFFGAAVMFKRRNRQLPTDEASVLPLVNEATDSVLRRVDPASRKRLVQMGNAIRDQMMLV
jgi:hypothetical protein